MAKYKVNGNHKRETFNNSELRCIAAQIIAASIKNSLMLAIGLSGGFPTILIAYLEEANSDGSYNVSEEEISWIGSVGMVFVPIGCALSGWITQALGRRRSMQLLNIPLLCSWIMFSYTTSVYVIFVALCVIGLAGGLTETPILTYVSEISQPRLRGMLSATSNMTYIAGIVVQYLFGAYLNWQILPLVNCAFPILSFILFFLVPESPYWLVVQNRLPEAKESIAWLRGWTSVEAIEAEFNDLCKYIENEKNNTQNQPKRRTAIWETVKLYTKKNFLWPYAIICLCFLLSHFSGMTSLRTYAVQIFASFRTPIDKYEATVYFGVAELFGCIVCVTLIHKLGKRILTFASLIGGGICCTVVATYGYYTGVNQLVSLTSRTNTTNENETINFNDSYDWVPLVFLILAAFIYYVSIRVLPWILIGELYSNETRAAAAGFTAATSYVIAFVVNKTFLSLTHVLTLPGMFWLYAASSFVGCVLLYVLLPETEGKPLWEITDHFNGGKSMCNSVRKKGKNDFSMQDGKTNEGFRSDRLDKETNSETYM